MNERVPTVAIGGINASNVEQVLYQSKVSSKGLDGVAVVSAIIAAEDPKAAASELQSLIKRATTVSESGSNGKRISKCENILRAVPALVMQLGQNKPLCHNITNTVVQNFAANVALAMCVWSISSDCCQFKLISSCSGASPIMASHGSEAEDLSKLTPVALVINIGTITPDGTQDCLQALRAYNIQGNPVLFDPVGAGATQLRRNVVKALMTGGRFDVIKGNEREVMTLWDESSIQQRGVDSHGSTLNDTEKARLVRNLAARESKEGFATK